jgi:hypothetical protein
LADGSSGSLAKSDAKSQMEGVLLGEQPVCPYCGCSPEVVLPEIVEGQVQIRCPKCDSLFSFTPGIGSFPVEDDLEIHISTSRLGSRLSIGPPSDTIGKSGNILSRVILCFSIGLALIVIAVFIVSLISLGLP